MAIIKFDCDCGNQDPTQAMEYDGMLGYEAIICKRCGAYSDNLGTHEPNEWSCDQVNLPVTVDLLNPVELWKTLGDTPVNDDGDIEEAWHIFPVGTNREDIWQWFEEKFNLSVVKDLMRL